MCIKFFRSPEIFLENAKGISVDDLTLLRGVLIKKAEEMKGTVSVFHQYVSVYIRYTFLIRTHSEVFHSEIHEKGRGGGVHGITRTFCLSLILLLY